MPNPTDKARAQAILDTPSAVVRPWGARLKQGVIERWYATGDVGPAVLTGAFILAVGAGMVALSAHEMDKKMAPLLAGLTLPAPLPAGLDTPDASERLQLARHLNRALAKQGGITAKLAKVCDALSVRLPADSPEQFLDILDWTADKCGRNVETARGALMVEIHQRQLRDIKNSEGPGFNAMGPGTSPVSAGSNGMAL